MALADETPCQTHLTTTFRWPTRRKIWLRRRKLPTLRLGGKKPRRGSFLIRVLRKVRLKWLKLQYSCMLRKLKEYYRNLIKDVVEAGATIEVYQQRLVMEASLAVPVLGFNFYPSVPGSARPRSVFM
ncbi:uncharacterized protein LOC8280831 [Ricinus communis]|uniref:Uncharacterized protein n=1 Tax=Ricinus communis TaxID=3988 RepID=B9T8J8_RICCO|nr:uncharacterized protein LOC8280831 [Ricinus communis]EEF27816.1 conserved hypothetical protein [Ricinus communis]|eukprot:XP_002534567.1 uncharacterized protein LOC8280831 [Ricinus communis]